MFLAQAPESVHTSPYVFGGVCVPVVTKVLRREKVASKGCRRTPGSSGECLKVLPVADLKAGERSTHTVWLP